MLLLQVSQTMVEGQFCRSSHSRNRGKIWGIITNFCDTRL